MELTTYFSDRQRLTLKSLWIPAIMTAILGIIASIFHEADTYSYSYPGTITVLTLLTTLKWAIVYSWEQLHNKDYKKAIYIIAGYIVLNLAFNKFLRWVYPVLPPFIDHILLMIVWNTLLVTGICYISGKRNFWQIGLVAGLLICYTTDVPFNPLSYIRIWYLHLNSIFADFILPFMLYGWIYLTENYCNEKGYSHIITSKIQVTSGKEYRFLYPLVAISCWVIIFQFSGLIKYFDRSAYSWEAHSGFQSQATGTMVVNFVIEICIFYITAVLTRNIVVSRMNTIANNNGWLYLLHFIPIVNIIVWYFFAKAAPLHNCKNANAAFYLTQRDKAVNNFIIGLGVLSTTWSLWVVYQSASRGTSAATGLLFLILFVKLVNYFFLDKGKNAVTSLVVLSTVASLIQFIERLSMDRPGFALFMVSVLSYFFLIEIFHPALEQADTDNITTATSIE